ncbi:RnfABCDGE type electron transport complex subunit B [Thiovibrio frasassiensis]|jgi:electron transport complex protein RnfB|uniref:Ion-translocating oxidoreductase complex subunit B n=1 Tax=Thiovibrio frasassiensis TaxID=2984131 RepID=A0A9X4RKW8_9BACT|nr:Fe-S cluster domain-containing protein [Thiovibrio frasassiensis]MDG4474965.1 Fe-S cluster domain-containing protein [Thiovibrio frasassiensis]
MDPALVKLALGGIALLGCIGLFFGIGLALAAHRFAVEANPLIEEVLESLAGAQCGGCGYPGCEGYAIAVVTNPEVPPNLCYPGKEKVAERVALLTGKKMAELEDMIALVRCSRKEGRVSHKHEYIGFASCTAANLGFGGPSSCNYSCIGLGECAASCPFDAITMVDSFPVVNPDKCVACGTCVRACPKRVIELMSLKARVYVPCSTKDLGKNVRKVCEVGCISCQMCVKKCPAEAVAYTDGLIVVDHPKCIAYGAECQEICVEKCPRNIMRKYEGRAAIARQPEGLKMAS